MTDYFDTAFYIHLNVGKFGKDYEVVKEVMLKQMLGAFFIFAGLVAIAGSGW